MMPLLATFVVPLIIELEHAQKTKGKETCRPHMRFINRFIVDMESKLPNLVWGSGHYFQEMHHINTTPQKVCIIGTKKYNNHSHHKVRQVMLKLLRKPRQHRTQE